MSRPMKRKKCDSPGAGARVEADVGANQVVVVDMVVVGVVGGVVVVLTVQEYTLNKFWRDWYKTIGLFLYISMQ